MATSMKGILKYCSWILPHGIHRLKAQWMARADLQKKLHAEQAVLNLVCRNKKFESIHNGKRCFILGNGPSVQGVDLTQLRGEFVFTVSNGYLHTGFSDILSKYHCIPQITYGKMTEDDVVAWFKEMHEHIGDAELFLNETEASLVSRYHLFPGRAINYVGLLEDFDHWLGRGLIDISKPIPRCQSAPVMMLMIAMYMGFNEIILLGVDHAELKTRKYGYPFKLKVQNGKDMSVGSNEMVVNTMHDDLQAYARLWRQYRVLHKISEANSIQIVNASDASELDEFSRVSLTDYLRK